MRVKYISWLNREEIEANPNCCYLFGDNLLQKGFGGQAKECRGLPNTIGIPTKKYPSMDENAFFTDTDFFDNIRAIDLAFSKIPETAIILYIPITGLGTGFAQLEERAPLTLKHIQSRIKDLFSKNKNL